MTIYGVSILAACLLVGDIAGRLIGAAIGVEANVGGVGIAMLLLLFLLGRDQSRLAASPGVRNGVEFWAAMYIPIVVAMAATQNVAAALSSGAIAIIAGLAAVALALIAAPLLSRLAGGGA